MKKFNLTPIAAVTLMFSVSAFAQISTSTLPAVVVTASPIIESNNVDGFSGFSTKVTDTQIKDLGALDLAAALRMTPGVQISRYNEVGSYSGDQGGNVYIRECRHYHLDHHCKSQLRCSEKFARQASSAKLQPDLKHPNL